MRFPKPSRLLKRKAFASDVIAPDASRAEYPTPSVGFPGVGSNASAANRQLIMAAFEASYEAIVRYVTIRIGDRDQAEDVASEVFAKALKNAGSFKQDGKPIEAWLFKIAHNMVVDHYRRQARRGSSVPLDQANEIPSDKDGLEHIAQMDDIAALKEAMPALTAAEREVIALRFGSQLSPAEIGTVLGKSSGAVRWLQHSAIVKLRQRLGYDEPGGNDAS